jgi:hypothetical protein
MKEKSSSYLLTLGSAHISIILALYLIKTHLLPQLEDHQPNAMFQQECAPTHWASIVREFVDMRGGLGR